MNSIVPCEYWTVILACVFFNPMLACKPEFHETSLRKKKKKKISDPVLQHQWLLEKIFHSGFHYMLLTHWFRVAKTWHMSEKSPRNNLFLKDSLQPDLRTQKLLWDDKTISSLAVKLHTRADNEEAAASLPTPCKPQLSRGPAGLTSIPTFFPSLQLLNTKEVFHLLCRLLTKVYGSNMAFLPKLYILYAWFSVW